MLISAAILDDVCGLVLVSVIHQLRGLADRDGSLGWIIGRPILASGLLAILTPLISKFVLGPVFRGFCEARFARLKHVSNILLMVLVLSAFLAISAYAGASVLFGSFLAGTVLSSLPSRRPEGPFVVTSRNHGEESPEKTPTFLHTFERYIRDVQRYVLQPLFFASIGFSVPFLDMWRGEMIWKGIVFSILMVCGKLVVGICVPAWDLITSSGKSMHSVEGPTAITNWAPAALLGTAMVARGEIGLLIIQIGLNETPYLSEKAFIIAIWAIVVNTIVGPISVGILLRKIGARIANDSRWGTQANDKALNAHRVVVSLNALPRSSSSAQHPRDGER